LDHWIDWTALPQLARSPYLLHNVNIFGAIGGYDAIRDILLRDDLPMSMLLARAYACMIMVVRAK
jgi:hypothetical protein